MCWLERVSEWTVMDPSCLSVANDGRRASHTAPLFWTSSKTSLSQPALLSLSPSLSPIVPSDSHGLWGEKRVTVWEARQVDEEDNNNTVKSKTRKEKIYHSSSPGRFNHADGRPARKRDAQENEKRKRKWLCQENKQLLLMKESIGEERVNRLRSLLSTTTLDDDEWPTCYFKD